MTWLCQTLQRQRRSRNNRGRMTESIPQVAFRLAGGPILEIVPQMHSERQPRQTTSPGREWFQNTCKSIHRLQRMRSTSTWRMAAECRFHRLLASSRQQHT